MKYLLFTSIILSSIISSCSFNKLYLIPRELTTESTFKDYDALKDDSVTLSFTKPGEPLFLYSDSSEVAYNYSIENLFFTNANNDSIHAWMMTPKGYVNSTTLLFLHGNAGNIVYQYQLAYPFVKRGYQVLLIDYSGFGFSQGKATRANVRLDADAAIEYLTKRSDQKDKKLLLYGQSLGGHLAASVASDHESSIDGLVIEGAFSSHKDIAALGFGFLGRWLTKEGYSAKEVIGDFNKPVLIIHSNEDRRIPFSQGQLLYEAATEPKAFYEIDQCHICGPLHYADEIVHRMEQLFQDKSE